MNQKTIVQLANQMSSEEDLLNLLNRIKQEEMSENGLGDKYHPFTMELLHYYCNPNHTSDKHPRYKQFSIKKKSGGERLISAPRSRSFLAMLQCVNELFKAMYTPSEYAMGFTEGRSIVDNAARHMGKNYVFNTDLKDFFPSIEQPRIWKRLQLPPFKFPVKIANILAGLCSMQTDEITNVEKGYHRCVLPQGAPTSPIITNMICNTLDKRLAGLAKRFGLEYSRYADDITFSSMHNVYQKGGDFIKELHRIIEGQGFKINVKKTRLCRMDQRQEVTGIIVNRKLNVTQKYVRDLRNILYIWERYGQSVAFAKFFPKYKKEKGHVKKGTPDLVNVIDGKLMYLKMVKGEEDSVYLRLHDKFIQLTSSRPITTSAHDVSYENTIPLVTFEKNVGTKVVVTRENKTVAKGKGNDKTEQQVLVRKGYFKIGEEIYDVSISRNLTKDDEEHKERLSISKCRNAKGKSFWYLHMSGRIPTPQPVDIDSLNKDLDLLLTQYGR